MPTYTISRLARQFGLSRSTLLYYDRIGLLPPSGRSAAGYRYYTEADAERLEAICTYRQAGISLKEIGQVLATRQSPQITVLKERLKAISREIRDLRGQQRLISGLLKTATRDEVLRPVDKSLWVEMLRQAGMDEEGMRRWHMAFEQRAPEAHHEFLLSLGISEKEAIQIRMLSSSMERNQSMMEYFYQVYEGIPRQGPGDEASTLKALNCIGNLPASPMILDVGCGTGAQTLTLARHLGGTIVAVDNHQPFLDRLAGDAGEQSLRARIEPRLASMFELPFEPGSFDLIWAEGSIYFMGFENGLRTLRFFLREKGALVASEVSWLKSDPPEDVKTFWAAEYPAITTIDENLRKSEAAGFTVIDHFTLPAESWWADFYRPQETRLDELIDRYAGNADAINVFDQCRREIELFRNYSDYYGYVFYVLRQAG